MRPSRPQSLTFAPRNYRGDRPSALVIRLADKASMTRDQTAERHAQRFTPWLLLCLAVALFTLIHSLR